MERSRMGRKAQFYIIAALIIVFVIIGIVVVGNYVRTKPKYTKIYDLGEELRIETGEVVSHGIYNKKDTGALIREWSERYYDYSSKQGFFGNWVFVYGDEKNITLLTFSNITAGQVSITLGGRTYGIEIPATGIIEESYEPEGNKVRIEFQNVTYDFSLKEGQNFFFVIKAGGYSTTSENLK